MVYQRLRQTFIWFLLPDRTIIFLLKHFDKSIMSDFLTSLTFILIALSLVQLPCSPHIDNI